MLPSSPADRLRWPRDEFPNWNAFMDYLDVEIARGLVDFKVFKARDCTDLETMAAEIMGLLTAPIVEDPTLI